MTTTTTKSGLLLGGLDPSKFQAISESLSQGDKLAPVVEFATGQFINGKGKTTGMFIKEKELPLAGWYGMPLPSGVKETTITFGSGKDSNQDNGFLFSTLNLVVVDVSPRFLAVTPKGEVAFLEEQKKYQSGQPYDPSILQLGNKHSLISIFKDADGNTTNPQTGQPYGGIEIRNALPEDNDFTYVKTFYLVMLCNEAGEFLHSKPICLSLKGLTAVAFGEALEFTAKTALAEIAEVTGNSKLASSTLKRSSLREFRFIMELEGDSAGSRNNWITTIARDEEGTLKVGIGSVDDPKQVSMLNAIYECNDGFAWKYSKQMEKVGYHQLQGNLAGNTHALPGVIDVSPLEGIEDNSDKFDF